MFDSELSFSSANEKFCHFYDRENNDHTMGNMNATACIKWMVSNNH